MSALNSIEQRLHAIEQHLEKLTAQLENRMLIPTATADRMATASRARHEETEEQRLARTAAIEAMTDLPAAQGTRPDEGHRQTTLPAKTGPERHPIAVRATMQPATRGDQ